MMTTRMVRSSSLFKQLDPRLFSSSALTGSGGGVLVSPMRSPAMCVRAFPVRFASGAAANSASIGQEERESEAKKEAATVPAGQRKVASYWGITPSKIAKEDGTEWRWHCFKPWDTYKSDLSIDLKKHHVPTTFFDKVALWTVKSLRVPTDIFFQEVCLSCYDA